MSRAPAVLALAILFTLAACDTAPFEAESPLPGEMAVMFDAKTPVSGSISAQLAQVRRLTAPFHDFDKGRAAGWEVPLSECIESPDGGMGYHMGNPEYINDSVHPLEPEVLLYEPQKNGRMRLVGVEYIVPVEVEEVDGVFPRPDQDAPVLFDQEFHWNPILSLWVLHVWIWRENPTGMFADFNPKVSCKFAPPAE